MCHSGLPESRGQDGIKCVRYLLRRPLWRTGQRGMKSGHEKLAPWHLCKERLKEGLHRKGLKLVLSSEQIDTCLPSPESNYATFLQSQSSKAPASLPAFPFPALILEIIHIRYCLGDGEAERQGRESRNKCELITSLSLHRHLTCSEFKTYI